MLTVVIRIAQIRDPQIISSSSISFLHYPQRLEIYIIILYIFIYVTCVTCVCMCVYMCGSYMAQSMAQSIKLPRNQQLIKSKATKHSNSITTV